jgi:hypothetical protein
MASEMEYRLLAQIRTSGTSSPMSGFRGWSQLVGATLYLAGEMECGLMVHKFHGGFTAAEKTELWDRWKRGESLNRTSFWQAVIFDLLFGGSAWWDSSGRRTGRHERRRDICDG